MPTVEDNIARLAGSRIFSGFDMAGSKRKTALNVNTFNSNGAAKLAFESSRASACQSTRSCRKLCKQSGQVVCNASAERCLLRPR